jgi:hypothetical protein
MYSVDMNFNKIKQAYFLVIILFFVIDLYANIEWLYDKEWYCELLEVYTLHLDRTTCITLPFESWLFWMELKENPNYQNMFFIQKIYQICYYTENRKIENDVFQNLLLLYN